MTGRNLRTVAAVALASGLAAVGCAKHTSEISPPAPSQSTLTLDDTAQRLSDLQRTTDQLNVDSQRLPGKSSTVHRTIMLDVLADYGKVLPLLAGPRAGLVFREQVETVNGARGQLASQSPDLSPDPAIDNGLRATQRALSDLATAEVFSSAELSSLFDALTAKLNELDNVHGPLHEVVVQEAVDKTNQIIDQMAQILITRLTPPPAPATPTTEPTTESTTAPTTESTTAPASEPATAPASEPAPAAAPDSQPATAPAATTEPAAMPSTMPASMPATAPTTAAGN
jgi:hypothetical protein